MADLGVNHLVLIGLITDEFWRDNLDDLNRHIVSEA